MELLQRICSFLAWILGLFSTVILIRIIVSWILLFVRRSSWRSGSGDFYDQENQGPSSLLITLDTILGKICDPYLHLFSGVKSLHRSNIDLTPLLALVLLNFIRSVLSFLNTTMLSSSSELMVISAICLAISAPSLIAIPASAAESAGESLIPSPTMIT